MTSQKWEASCWDEVKMNEFESVYVFLDHFVQVDMREGLLVDMDGVKEMNLGHRRYP